MNCDRSSSLYTALAGLAGTILLIGSFVINPGPPAGAGLDEVVEFGRQHATSIMLGGWMQGMGSVLSVLFAVGLVQLARRASTLASWLTVLSGMAIVSATLIETASYFASLDAGLGDNQTVLATALTLLKAVQHLYLIVPAILLPVGWTVLRTRLLPAVAGYTGLAVGAALQVLGVAGLFWPVQPIVDDVLIVQGVWFVAASLMLGWQALASGSPQSSSRPLAVA
ncbi:MAG: DUF4386 family protein [Chloroflexi bacterium]|nr:DUF4386 family protein [Chloroflexota bacterium]